MARLSDLHIPVGGDRFRPAFEDVLEFAIEELGVQARSGWRQRIGEERAHYRRIQLAAAIADAPEIAAMVLREELGYSIVPRDDVPQERTERLRAI